MPPVVEVWSPNHWTARESPSPLELLNDVWGLFVVLVILIGISVIAGEIVCYCLFVEP